MYYQPLSSAMRVLNGEMVPFTSQKSLEKTMDAIFGLSACKLKGAGILAQLKEKGYRVEGLVAKQSYDDKKRLVSNRLAILIWGRGIPAPTENLFTEDGVAAYVLDLLENNISLEHIPLVEDDNGAKWE